jgi:hypothetical protein
MLGKMTLRVQKSGIWINDNRKPIAPGIFAIVIGNDQDSRGLAVLGS